jgi:hypothetical protein
VFFITALQPQELKARVLDKPIAKMRRSTRSSIRLAGDLQDELATITVGSTSKPAEAKHLCKYNWHTGASYIRRSQLYVAQPLLIRKMSLKGLSVSWRPLANSFSSDDDR